VIARKNFNFLGFILGLCAVTASHLSANLINDYADSITGADWQDKNSYKFFGGSKLIQQQVFPEKFYRNAAIIFMIISALCVFILSLILKSFLPVALYSIITVLSWFYSVPPFRFSYRRLGEIIIFVLFGPALVMSGYYIQTKIFPDLKSFLLSVPFGIFTTAILFANEVPDFTDDQKVGKNTWVSLLGPNKSFLLYYLLQFTGFIFILINIAAGFLNHLSLVAFLFIIPMLRAATIIKNSSDNKIRLIQSSKLTICVQTFVSICLIVAVLLS
jgi:1,4-dihydroxy-2-naphthoate octaprenyltransferase